ncbi:MAG TPA: thiamine phosphate synthase [Bryobacteraceae bacterium]|nr:thiamine phosphate synthase [Bryobacteraceae bacterium]
MSLPRLYPILDTAALHSAGTPLLEAAIGMIEAGVQIIQLRHKGHFSRELFEAAAHLAVLCEQAQIGLVINDRCDMARLLNAHVHLGQDDLLPVFARQLMGPDTIVGLSTHNREQLEAANREPVDYHALGPIFGTASKRNPDPVVGVESLAQWRPLSARPLVAIGGITLENVGEVLRAGADSVAVISALLPAAGADRKSIREKTEEWLHATKA